LYYNILIYLINNAGNFRALKIAESCIIVKRGSSI